MAIEWKEEYSVQVKEIDTQHKNLIKIINELYQAIYNKEVDKKLVQIFDKLINFAIEHFTTEEKYFDIFNYENSKYHKEKHQKFKSQILDFQKKIGENKLKLSFELADFLEDWLVDHLMNEDQKYVKCFKEHGLK